MILWCEERETAYSWQSLGRHILPKYEMVKWMLKQCKQFQVAFYLTIHFTKINRLSSVHEIQTEITVHL